MSDTLQELIERATTIADEASGLAEQAETLQLQQAAGGADPFFLSLTVFALACFVGYYVVWKVTPALHTPLMAVTNAISGVVIVGAIIALGAKGGGVSNLFGFLAVILASVNIFGGFIVTQRMLEMFKKKEKPAARPANEPAKSASKEAAS